MATAQELARKAVRAASELLESDQPKQWLWYDERGTWEREAREWLARADAHPRRDQFSEEEVLAEVAQVLALHALEACKGMHS